MGVNEWVGDCSVKKRVIVGVCPGSDIVATRVNQSPTAVPPRSCAISRVGEQRLGAARVGWEVNHEVFDRRVVNQTPGVPIGHAVVNREVDTICLAHAED
jgi:hypothetical protein